MAAKAVPISLASVLLPVPPFCEATLILIAIHSSVLSKHDIMRACGHVKGVSRRFAGGARSRCSEAVFFDGHGRPALSRRLFWGVRVSDVRREEFEDAPGRRGVRGKKGGEGKTVLSGHQNQIVGHRQLAS